MVSPKTQRLEAEVGDQTVMEQLPLDLWVVIIKHLFSRGERLRPKATLRSMLLVNRWMHGIVRHALSPERFAAVCIDPFSRRVTPDPLPPEDIDEVARTSAFDTFCADLFAHNVAVYRETINLPARIARWIGKNAREHGNRVVAKLTSEAEALRALVDTVKKPLAEDDDIEQFKRRVCWPLAALLLRLFNPSPSLHVRCFRVRPRALALGLPGRQQCLLSQAPPGPPVILICCFVLELLAGMPGFLFAWRCCVRTACLLRCTVNRHYSALALPTFLVGGAAPLAAVFS